MKKALNLSQRSEDLTNIIKALNEWATAPEGTSQVAFKEALNVYGRAVRAGVYAPIGWEFCYARNTLNKNKAPVTKGSFESHFGAPEAPSESASTDTLERIRKGTEKVVSTGTGEPPF